MVPCTKEKSSWSTICVIFSFGRERCRISTYSAIVFIIKCLSHCSLFQTKISNKTNMMVSIWYLDLAKRSRHFKYPSGINSGKKKFLTNALCNSTIFKPPQLCFFPPKLSKLESLLLKKSLKKKKTVIYHQEPWLTNNLKYTTIYLIFVLRIWTNVNHPKSFV